MELLKPPRNTPCSMVRHDIIRVLGQIALKTGYRSLVRRVLVPIYHQRHSKGRHLRSGRSRYVQPLQMVSQIPSFLSHGISMLAPNMYSIIPRYWHKRVGVRPRCCRSTKSILKNLRDGVIHYETPGR